jgi:hypothetical protein
MLTHLPCIRVPLCAVLLVALAGCASGGESIGNADRAATDLPDHFLVGTFMGPETTEPSTGEGCRNPMVDPRDDTRLMLTRSSGGRGDYAVPAGRYGVAANELLRLDCASGVPIGIVRK